MLYTKSYQIFCSKKISMLTGFHEIGEIHEIGVICLFIMFTRMPSNDIRLYLKSIHELSE